ncbi:MAG: hypothetical protein WC947_01340 [Elusimicrobiota bacterium]
MKSKKTNKIYTRYGIVNPLDPYQVVYYPARCVGGGYNNSGHRVGGTLPDGRRLVAGKKVVWLNYCLVYAVR